MVPSSTLILGPAKSGTTALFYAVRAAMNRATGQQIAGLFEPRDMDAYRRYFASSGDAVFLCKALLGPVMRGMRRALDRFDRRIVLSRDPRDNIVSRLLFMPPRLLAEINPAKSSAYVELIRRKQSDPTCLSVLAILHELEVMTGREGLVRNFRDNSILPASVRREYGDSFWMFGYDELVEGRFGRLSEYLGFEVSPQFEVAGQHGYVSRSKGSGEWKSWFLPEDIDYFAREVAEDYALMGFDAEETADPAPAIDAATAVGYVQKQFDRLESKKAAGRDRKRQELQQVVVAAKVSDWKRELRVARNRNPVPPVDGNDTDDPLPTGAGS